MVHEKKRIKINNTRAMNKTTCKCEVKEIIGRVLYNLLEMYSKFVNSLQIQAANSIDTNAGGEEMSLNFVPPTALEIMVLPLPPRARRHFAMLCYRHRA